MRLQQGYGAEGLRGLHADQVVGHRAQVAAQQPGQLHDGERPAVLAGGRDRRLEQRRPGQRPGTVVHRDDVDLAGVDVLGQRLQRRPLRGVPGGAAGHQADLALTEQRRDRLADGVLVAGADAEHQPHQVRHRQRGAHRLAEHGGVAEGQQHLVGVRADPAAGPGGEDHDGGGHGQTVTCLLHGGASGETRRP